jgi:hypothetical protein
LCSACGSPRDTLFSIVPSANDGDAETRAPHVLPALEAIAKGSVAAVAICYALGLVIKNIYLALWSTFSAKLIEVEYVLSGALFILLCLLGISFWSVTSGVRRRVRLRRNKMLYAGGALARSIARLTTLAVFALGVSVIVFFLSVIANGILAPRTYVIACAAILILPALAILARQPIGEIWALAVLGRDVTGQAQMRLFFTAAPLVLALVLHAIVIYPNVSPAYGGGRHSFVQLYMNETGAKILRAISFSSDPSDPRLFEAELIFEDDNYLTLVARNSRTADRTAVRVRRDQVESIITRPLIKLKPILGGDGTRRERGK